jgi:hypothetical protein
MDIQGVTRVFTEQEQEGRRIAGAVSWNSKKQELVTLSAIGAEYVAATHAAKDVLWLKQFWAKVLGVSNILIPSTPIINLRSRALTSHSEGTFHARTKHIDIRYHFIRHVIENDSIKLISVYCPTEKMMASILTKPLPSAKAKHFAKSLRLTGV